MLHASYYKISLRVACYANWHATSSGRYRYHATQRIHNLCTYRYTCRTRVAKLALNTLEDTHCTHSGTYTCTHSTNQYRYMCDTCKHANQYESVLEPINYENSNGQCSGGDERQAARKFVPAHNIAIPVPVQQRWQTIPLDYCDYLFRWFRLISVPARFVL